MRFHHVAYTVMPSMLGELSIMGNYDDYIQHEICIIDLLFTKNVSILRSKCRNDTVESFRLACYIPFEITQGSTLT